MGDVIEKVSYDQIYDEHVYLFSCHAIKNIFSKYGLNLVDCRHLDTHGGSMRYYLQKSNNPIESNQLVNQLNHEKALGMLDIDAYKDFARKCEITKIGFKEKLVHARTMV